MLTIYEAKLLYDNTTLWIRYYIDNPATVQVLVDGIEIFRVYIDGVTYPLGERTFNLPRPSWMDATVSHQVCVEVV